jgi:uncharacterized membrane protein
MSGQSLQTDDHVGLERLVFFSDAVFAIAITLLALEIRLPAGEGDLNNAELWASLTAIWPKYLAYILSFLVIGIFWIGHHRRYRFIQRYDGNLLFLNLLLLMVVAFIPFPTSLISEHGNQTATIFYAATMTVSGLVAIIIWLYASRGHRLIDPDLDRRTIQRETLRLLVVPAIFVLSIGLAFINDDLAKFAWVLVAPAVLFTR